MPSLLRHGRGDGIVMPSSSHRGGHILGHWTMHCGCIIVDTVLLMVLGGHRTMRCRHG